MPVSRLNGSVAIVGGGLAGLAAAVALGSSGQRVTLYEARPFLGGRATSYPLNTADENSPLIDNCQHILLRCCTNLIDFYRRLGVADRIHFYREFTWIEPGGRRSVLRRGWLPAPFHFTGSFARLRFLSARDKIGIARALLSVRKEYGKRADLDQITMLDWLREKKQTPRAIERFWRQVCVSAISEDLERMAAIHGLQVFSIGFLSSADAYEFGVPSVPLGELYSEDAWSRYPQVKIVHRSPVQEVRIENGRVTGLVVNGDRIQADAYVVAVPFERLGALAPGLPVDVSEFSHAPITGIHLWFDRAITDLPHATLLDRTIQWMFNKHEGRHIQLVVSASRSLTDKPRGEVIELALRELKEFFPRVAECETRTRSRREGDARGLIGGTGTGRSKAGHGYEIPNLFLAGDWTRSGWPAIMEGAVRSGYLAAEAVLKSFGTPERFLLPDASSAGLLSEPSFAG